MSTTTPRTVADELALASSRLAAAGCPHPYDDAVTLMAYALDLDARDVGEKSAERLESSARQAFDSLVTRREAREPLAYITGLARFRGVTVSVDRRVLVPEAQSGPLVDVALELPHGARVHDVGTGSGAIALAIKQERPDLVVTGSDISPGAVAVARENAARTGYDVSFEVADGVPLRHYDLVVGSLPYGDLPARLVYQSPEAG